ncbi:MAG: hypothetical protein KF708_15550 [Pirellulales bacterium]|nr:hypothetical protein [Pirellulales bacterium]
MPKPTRFSPLQFWFPAVSVGALTIVLWGAAEGAAQEPGQPTRGSAATRGAGRAPQVSDGISGKVLRYASKLVAKHDADLDGRLQEPEWRRMSGTPRLADLDGDGIITVHELAQRVASYSRQRTLRLMPAREAEELPVASAEEPAAEDNEATVALEGPMANPAPEAAAAGNPAPGGNADNTDQNPDRRRTKKSKQFFVPTSRLPKGVAKWFSERDANGDGQVSMVEYSSKWSQAEALEFARYDKNGDGIITPDEATTGTPKRTKNEPAPTASADAGNLPAGATAP